MTTTTSTIDAVWHTLVAESSGERFDPGTLDALPAPARRYLLRAIAPDTPLAASVELRMRGSIRLSRSSPWLPMLASQIINERSGFLWRATIGALLPFVGFDRYSDGDGEMCWRLAGVIPIVHAQGPDITRSARERYAGELVFLPAALLPRTGVVWSASDASSACATLDLDGAPIALHLQVSPGGHLSRVQIDRWSNLDAPDGRWRPRPFVVQCSGEQQFGGYTVPAQIAAGWWRDDEWLFEFFRAELLDAVYR